MQENSTIHYCCVFEESGSLSVKWGEKKVNLFLLVWSMQLVLIQNILKCEIDFWFDVKWHSYYTWYLRKRGISNIPGIMYDKGNIPVDCWWPPQSETTIRDLIETWSLGICQFFVLHGLFETWCFLPEETFPCWEISSLEECMLQNSFHTSQGLNINTASRSIRVS